MTASSATAARVVNGASRFGIKLSIDGNDNLVFECAYAPSPGLLDRIKDHEAAIVAYLKDRRSSSRKVFDQVKGFSRPEVAAYVAKVQERIGAQQAARR